MPETQEFVVPEVIPILPMPEGVAFPYTIVPVTATNQSELHLVDDSVSGNKTIGLVSIREGSEPPYDQEDLYEVGTVSGIVKLYRFPGDVVRLNLKGLARFRILESVETSPYITARVEKIRTVWPDDSMELEAWRKNIENQLREIVELSPGVPDEVQLLGLVNDPERLGFVAASGIEANTKDKQKVLEEHDMVKRLKLLSRIMGREIKVLRLRNKIQGQVRSEIEQDQKEYYLKEQMKAIQKELGGETENPEVLELRKKLARKQLPDEARTAAEEELKRLARMPSAAPEVAVTRNYIEWLLQLPWMESTRDMLSIDRARRILDNDHYDLKEVKQRVLEFLAVRMLNPEASTPILCFVGPPGVGKTSMGKSIARALGRRFVRLSLGGIHDEAEIRGHRRTYVGAMPGRIIQGLKEAGTNNPVFMLDEVDKIGRDFRGDPTSALLEVLDPEQNFSFHDNYLNVPFDLSKVKFITTANQLDTIPSPLRDRMEIIRIPGYTEEEKLEIARQYLIKKQRRNAGLDGKTLRFRKSGLRKIIDRYTREAGVRELERQIEKICRKVAMKVARGDESLTVLGASNVSDLLGAERYKSEVAGSRPSVGVATGLAWTPAGGEILFIETALMSGSGKVILTGHLGEVMKESASAALSWIRSRAEEYGLETDFNKTDIHVHVPAGATPKDGPSAGVPMLISILSALTGRPVRNDVAVTGEISLQGRVMPVGGVKEKVLGAKAAGINKVVLPGDNMKDLEEVPSELRKGMEFFSVGKVSEVVPMFLLEGEEGG
ncbi:endopeptidase La [Candidatus Fermentibacteria bacterium]|nr:endopeptidase La [Candidatus Fermentibacteria bacterium]